MHGADIEMETGLSNTSVGASVVRGRVLTTAGADEEWFAGGGRADVLDTIDREAAQEVERALAAADAAGWPEPASAYTDVQTTGDGRWR